MKTLQTRTIAMLSGMLTVSLILAVMLILKAIDERRDAERYSMMEKIAGNLNAMAGWQGIERGTGVVILGDANPPATLLDKFNGVEKKLDAEAELAASEIKRLLAFEADADIEKKFNEWLSVWGAVQVNRPKVKAAGINAKDWIAVTTKNIESAFFLRTIVFSPHNPREKVFYYNAVVRANVATLCEFAGRERATLAAIIATGKPVSPEQRETLKFWRSIVDDNVAQMLALKTLSTTPKPLVDEIDNFEKEFLGHYQQLREQIYTLSASNKPYPVTGAEWITRSTKAIDTGLAISNIIGSISAEAANNISSASRNAMILNLVLLGFAVLVFGISIFALRFLVLKPISNLIVVMEGIAEGDLSIDIPDLNREDEIGLLANAANSMQTKLRELTLELWSHATDVYTAAQQIVGAIEEQAATTNQMSASVAEITSTMEELSASSTQIAEHSLSVANIATQNWENSKKGSESMRVALSKMSDIRSDNQHSLKEIVDLGKRSKEITKVMQIINTVADQTKLIAFNAALEASSAGEAGRRFGVVAAEIRRLADSVTESTNEIEAKINDIQESTSRLVITSEKGSVGIADGMAATATTSDQLEKLVDAANQTNSAAKQISLSTQQQKTASNQVVMALREIATASNQTAESISHISHVCQDMTLLSAKLNELVGRFKLNKS